MEQKKEKKVWGFQCWTDRRFFLTAWGIFFAAEFVLWLALFPGIFGYDSYKQMAFYTGLEVWSTHHPVFHTWLLGTLLTAGKAVFGSYNAGVALYTFLQMLLISSVYAYVLRFLRKRGVPVAVLAVSAIFLLVHPAIQLLNFNTTKDTLFGVCFLYFLLLLIEILEGEGGRRGILLFSVFGLLSCLLRNQGVYVMAALILCLAVAWLLGRRRKKLQIKGVILSLIVVCVLTEAFSFFCTGILHMPKGEVREMLSVPMQQTAAVLIADREGRAELADAEREIARTLVSDKALAVYAPDTADPVKGLFPSAQFQAYKGDYIKNYLAIGAKNPGIYLKAWFVMIRPYWDMSLANYRGLMAEYTGGSEEAWGIGERPVLPFVGKKLKVLAVCDDYRHIPVFSWIFNPGFYIWAAAAVLILSVIRKKINAFLACIPGLLYFATLLLGPVALVRYLYPLLLSLPVIIGLLFERSEEEKQ